MSELIFFDGEDEGALKQAFIDFSSRHYKSNFSALEIAQHVFKNLHEPFRYIQAADVWAKDLEVQEAIRQKILFGQATDAREKRIELLNSIAEDIRQPAKERIAAVRDRVREKRPR